MKKKGTNMALIESAGAGDIISMAGMASPSIGHTVANTEVRLCSTDFFPPYWVVGSTRDCVIYLFICCKHAEGNLAP